MTSTGHTSDLASDGRSLNNSRMESTLRGVPACANKGPSDDILGSPGEVLPVETGSHWMLVTMKGRDF